MTTKPTLIYNQQDSNMFQIVLSSYKSIISNDFQQIYKKNNDLKNSHNTLKWSMKLFFYIFYGLFPNTFFENLRKKYNQITNKDAINSILLHLRMHPVLLGEKEQMAIPKPIFDDAIFKWPQYCLDKSYTVLNNNKQQKINVIDNQIDRLIQTQFSTNNNNNCISLCANDNNNAVTLKIHNHNLKTSLTTELPKSQLSFDDSLNNQSNLINLQKKLDFNNDQIKPIKNLTKKFMQSPEQLEKHQKSDKKIINNSRFSYYDGHDIDSLKFKTKSLSKFKSLSNPNLDISFNNNNGSYERRPKAQTSIGGQINKGIEIQQQENRYNMKQIRSEMRDSNIISNELFNQDFQQSSNYYNYSLLSNEEPNLNYRKDTIDVYNTKNDILSSYLIRSDCSESILKREYDALVHELMYERYLREKYEEFFNQAFTIKIENEQLIQEKTDLEELYAKEILKNENIKMVNNDSINKLLLESKEEYTRQLGIYKQKEEDAEKKYKELEEKFEECKENYKNLEKKYKLTDQALETEQRRKENDLKEGFYIKSLRAENEELKNKLLIMANYSNNLINNNPINAAKYFQLHSLHKNEMNDLNKKFNDMQNEYTRLLCEFKEKDTIVIKLENELKNKNKEIDELNQQISSTINQINLNLYKNNTRVYRSVSTVNARLESEAIKLRADIEDLKSQLNQQNINNLI